MESSQQTKHTKGEKPLFLTEHINATQYGGARARYAYIHRMPYTWACFEHITSDLNAHPERPKRALDLGCGMGDVAIPLAAHIPVDAVDLSESMISLGKLRPGGNNPQLTWHHGGADQLPALTEESRGAYGVVTAGDSIHWLPWAPLFEKLRAQLHPEGRLYILRRYYAHLPWADELSALERALHVVPNVEPYDTEALLEAGGYWRCEGREQTAPEPLRYRPHDYIEAMHSRNGFTRDRMSEEAQRRFDDELLRLITPHLTEDGWLEVGTYSVLTWGRLLR